MTGPGEGEIDDEELETAETELEDEENVDGEEEAGDEDDDGEEEEPEDGEGEEEDGEGEDEDLGARAKKRIGKLVGQRNEARQRVKELEAELEEAKKTGGEDAETYIAAARESGLLPSLMSKDLAKAIERQAENKRIIANYENWLDDEENQEIEIGGETWSRKKVRARLRELRDEQEELRRRFGGEEEKMRRNVKEIFALGQQALKAGWKPGAKKPGAVPPKKKAVNDKPGEPKGAPKAKKGRVDWTQASGTAGLAALIQASEKKRKV